MAAPADRAENYETPNVLGTRDLRLKKLKYKLREHIRRFHYRPLLSEEWLKMSDSINQVAEVAFMEMTIPFDSTNKKGQLGRKADGTLWDQEEEQLAITILLEEGKINLCLRLLREYSEAFKSEKQAAALIAKAAKKTNRTVKNVSNLAVAFEKGIGIIIHLSLEHVEVVQILDTTALIQHIGEILDNAPSRMHHWRGQTSSKFDVDFLGVDKFQESVVIHYLANLVKHLEELDEDKTMGVLDQYQIITKMVAHCLTFQQIDQNGVKADFYASGLLFLQRVIDSEAFQAEPEVFAVGNTRKLIRTFVDNYLPTCIATKTIKKNEVDKLVKQVKAWRLEE